MAGLLIFLPGLLFAGLPIGSIVVPFFWDPKIETTKRELLWSLWALGT